MNYRGLDDHFLLRAELGSLGIWSREEYRVEHVCVYEDQVLPKEQLRETVTSAGSSFPPLREEQTQAT